MPFNGAGVFQRVRNWVADAAAGIKIRADYHDAEDDGFATGLTNCIAKDGQTIITQNIPFNSKRITALADPVNAQDAATKAYADTKMSSTTDVKMLGDLEIENGSPSLTLDETTAVGTAGSGNRINGMRVGKMRWLMRLGDGTVEPGANVGSDFDVIRYNDAGSILGTVLKFVRSTGLGTVAGPPTADLGIATKKYVDDAIPTPDPQLFAGIPPLAKVGPYTTVATDAQKAIVGTGAITLAGALYPAGTCITFVANGGVMTIANAQTTYWNNGSAPLSGTRTLANVGVATAYKATSTTWFIGGSGLT